MSLTDAIITVNRQAQLHEQRIVDLEDIVALQNELVLLLNEAIKELESRMRKVEHENLMMH